jgi:hypothetical protein
LAPRNNISAPYGDIVLVSTPATDRWGQQLYAEQKMREARSQQENMALDATIQRELGKVRSVDTPDVINSYQRYKQLSKELKFNPSLRKNPLAYNQVKQAADAAYQNIFTTANEGAQAKEMYKSMFQEKLKNPNDFHDNAGQMLSALMNTPIAQLKSHPQYGDLTNADNYRDFGMNTNWGEEVRKAAGTAKEVYSEKSPMEGGLQTQITPYNYGSTPLQVKDYLLGSMGMRQAGKDAAKAWDSLPEEDIANTIKAYQALPKEYWQKMGLASPQDLFPKNPDSKAENFAAYQAMKYAISNEPKPGKPQIVQNLKAVKDLDWARQLQMQAIKNADARGLVELKKKLDPNDTDIQNVWYQAHLDRLIGDANANKERHHVYTTKGRSLYYYNAINPDPFTMKAFARNGREPDRIGVTESGQVIPVFFKKDEKGEKITLGKDGTGSPVIDEDDSKPMSYEQALISLGYRGATKKQLSSDLKGKIKSPSPKDSDPIRIFD